MKFPLAQEAPGPGLGKYMSPSLWTKQDATKEGGLAMRSSLSSQGKWGSAGQESK